MEWPTQQKVFALDVTQLILSAVFVPILQEYLSVVVAIQVLHIIQLMTSATEIATLVNIWTGKTILVKCAQLYSLIALPAVQPQL
jgi:hypothetical protein